ncbi:PQQ-dependent sugar dehydrogenase [Aquimarina sp. U1-2]|uniref:PQQ-dependent sugar dehydrogenase n=1 Tax=Aquimarina sp. U1-2 TaxID=2823141 RepID=UPI001AECBA84|nr:PQQ-dependent sugar dehydrogenase [Aquimarina sp. U1-2]MBP2831460.1 PQQ-dependent sugar dehydrogenase [Aquimarina sp. U1-2]
MKNIVVLVVFICFGCTHKPKVDLTKGREVYTANCAVCHQSNGLGIPETHPPIAETSWVIGSKERLIHIILNGLQDKITVRGEIYDNVMPGLPHLSDQDIANVLSYIRSDFGNNASAITEKEVKKVRSGESLEEPEGFSETKPSFDKKKYKASIKHIDKKESRVGSTYKKGQILLNRIHTPKGFAVEIFAEGLENPRSLTQGPGNTIFVGTRRNDDHFIYAIKDEDQDGKADRIRKLSNGLQWDPMGVAMRGKDLYVGEIDRILRYKNIEAQLDNPPEPEVIFNYPPVKKHGHKYIRFGPDDRLYVPVGAPCNVCLEENDIFSTITRISPDGQNFEIVAHGVRNSRGYDWHPKTKELWFSDNGRDLMGDDLPPCEINRVKEEGKHYGFPFYHGKDIKDPIFGNQRALTDFVPTAYDLVAHAAPVSLKFYTGNMFPKEYKNSILVSEHGSWNRSEKQGYRIMKLTLKNDSIVSYEPFVTGWLDDENNDAWGRPVDILQLPDGSILVSDDYAGAIYRISYNSKDPV